MTVLFFYRFHLFELLKKINNYQKYSILTITRQVTKKMTFPNFFLLFSMLSMKR